MATTTALGNSKTLKNTRDIQFPVLQTSESALVSLERVKESLAGAVTTGDEEALKNANALAEQLKKQLSQIGQLDSELNREIAPIIKTFDDYYAVAFQVSEGNG